MKNVLKELGNGVRYALLMILGWGYIVGFGWLSCKISTLLGVAECKFTSTPISSFPPEFALVAMATYALGAGMLIAVPWLIDNKKEFKWKFRI